MIPGQSHAAITIRRKCAVAVSPINELGSDAALN
jgi:hypothetical protein